MRIYHCDELQFGRFNILSGSYSQSVRQRITAYDATIPIYKTRCNRLDRLEKSSLRLRICITHVGICTKIPNRFCARTTASERSPSDAIGFSPLGNGSFRFQRLGTSIPEQRPRCVEIHHRALLCSLLLPVLKGVDFSDGVDIGDFATLRVYHCAKLLRALLPWYYFQMILDIAHW